MNTPVATKITGEQLDARLMSAIRPMAATLPESGIMTVLNYGQEKPGLIPFWAGEGDVPTPDFICAAASEALHQGHTFYTYQRGIPPLRQAVAAYLRRHFQANVEPERCVKALAGDAGVQLELAEQHLRVKEGGPAVIKKILAAERGTSTLARVGAAAAPYQAP